MTVLAALVAAALSVLPSDRLAMADRLFNRGEYADAKAEYAALKGEASIPGDEILYRLAECARALGAPAEANGLYGELLKGFPASRHVTRVRLERALLMGDAEKRAALRELDADTVEPAIRATALYHLGVLDADAAVLARAVKTDPKGRYAPYARFRRAAILVESKSADERRAGIGELLEIAFSGKDEMAQEALYLAGARSYAEGKYGEAVSLLERYMKSYPAGKRAERVRVMFAWSAYLAGKYAAAAEACGTGGTDDFDYLLGAAANATGDGAKARTLLAKYLSDHPQGRYRESAELAMSRLEFTAAEESGDKAKTLETARRSAELSKKPGDRLRYAWALEQAGREQEAVAEYFAIAKDNPGTDEAADALFRKALADIRAKRWNPAELALAEVLASPDRLTPARKGEALYWRGVAATQLGHAAEARGFLEDAVRTGLALDQNREARLLIADDDFNAGHAEAARSAYAKLVREGAAERMGAAKLLSVGRFLLTGEGGSRTVDEARACAVALEKTGGTPEWTQFACALRGECEEMSGAFAAAIGAYRKAMEQDASTEARPRTALRLGILEAKAGENDAALKTLGEAVRLNDRDSRARLDAYLWLAKAAHAKGDATAARAYATVVTTLFDDKEANDEAAAIIKANEGKGEAQ